MVGGERGGLVVPRGGMFSLPPPVLLQLVHSLKTRHCPSLLSSFPPAFWLHTLEVHLLCLISRLAMGYVYHQCTIFVAEVCMPHLGIGYQVQMGSLFKKATKALASSACTATGTESWNPIIHLISICSIPPSAQSQYFCTTLMFKFFYDNLRNALYKPPRGIAEPWHTKNAFVPFKIWCHDFSTHAKLHDIGQESKEQKH